MTAYLYGYLGIGVALLIVHRVWHEIAKHRGRVQRDILAEAMSRNQSLAARVAIDIAFYAVLSLIWPLIVILKIKESLSSDKKPQAEPAKKFEVPRDSMLRQLSVDEIEEVELIDDPLGAAPRLPFGHLNPQWLAFKSKLQSGDTIWIFSANWTDPDWGGQHLYEGYAVLRGDAVGPYMLTKRECLANLMPRAGSPGEPPVALCCSRNHPLNH